MENFLNAVLIVSTGAYGALTAMFVFANNQKKQTFLVPLWDTYELKLQKRWFKWIWVFFTLAYLITLLIAYG